jgi:hypothetical protein
MTSLTGLPRTVRAYSSTRTGGQFNAMQLLSVWQKGRPVQNYDPNRWRLDACGAILDRTKYGDTNSQYGWEIDHVLPAARGGTDDLSNLQPLHWQNNRRKGDGVFRFASEYCAVKWS